MYLHKRDLPHHLLFFYHLVLNEANALERVGRHTTRPEVSHLAVMTSANLIRDDEHALRAHVVTDDVISTLTKTLGCVLDDKVCIILSPKKLIFIFLETFSLCINVSPKKFVFIFL